MRTQTGAEPGKCHERDRRAPAGPQGSMARPGHGGPATKERDQAFGGGPRAGSGAAVSAAMRAAGMD